MKRLICFFIGHNYKSIKSTNGIYWSWNVLECKICKKQSDTLVD